MADRESDNILCYLEHNTIYGCLITQLNDYGDSISHLVCDKKMVRAGVPVIRVSVENETVTLQLHGWQSFVRLKSGTRMPYGEKLLFISKHTSEMIKAIKSLISQSNHD